MSDEYKKALLQVAGKLTEEQEKMCGGRERCAGCAWFDKLNLGASDSFTGCGQYIAAKKILAREQLIRAMLRDYEGDPCIVCAHFYKVKDNHCAEYESRRLDACFEGMIANLDADIPPKSGTNLRQKT